MNRTELRKACKAHDLDYSRVIAFAAELLEREMEGLRYHWEIRQAIHDRICPKRQRGTAFWRALGQWNDPRYNGAFCGGNDWTVIPRWDELADEIAERYPVFHVGTRPAEAVYEFIIQPIEPIPKLEQFFEEAIDRGKEESETLADAPF